MRLPPSTGHKKGSQALIPAQKRYRPLGRRRKELSGPVFALGQIFAQPAPYQLSHIDQSTYPRAAARSPEVRATEPA